MPHHTHTHARPSSDTHTHAYRLRVTTAAPKPITPGHPPRITTQACQTSAHNAGGCPYTTPSSHHELQTSELHEHARNSGRPPHTLTRLQAPRTFRPELTRYTFQEVRQQALNTSVPQRPHIPRKALTTSRIKQQTGDPVKHARNSRTRPFSVNTKSCMHRIMEYTNYLAHTPDATHTR